METYYYTNPETEEIEGDPSSSQTDLEPEAERIELILRTEHPPASYTAVSLAQTFDVSDTSIRKVFNGLKQGLPEDLLKTPKGGYTELSKQLIGEYYQRPDSQSAAEWFHSFIDIAKSIHDSGISMKPGSALAKATEESRKQSMLVKRDNLAALAKLRGYQLDVEEGDDAAFEAELETIREREYSRHLRRKLAVMEAREQVEEDLRESPGGTS